MLFRYLNISIIVVLIALTSSPKCVSQTLAFPDAEGFGKYTTGGRDGVVIKVTNLNDNGPGSLREAIKKNFPRIIVFEVSGTIYLKDELKVEFGDLTIAGQTAPGHGITLAHFNFRVEADNVIIRHIRSRLSAEGNQQEDAFTCRYGTNIMIDHCSFSWSVDEVASIYLTRKLTMQNCIIAEAFHNSIHDKGAHGYGGIWGGDSVSFHHNLIMHNTSRNPRFHGARWAENWVENVDFRNNVIYNWTNNSIYGGEPSELDGSPVFINIVNNYFKYGPSTSASIKNRIVEPYKNAFGYAKYFIDGNYIYESPETTADNWTYGVQNVSVAIKENIKSDTSYPYSITSIHTAEEAYEFVLKNAGTNVPFQDTVDRRLIWEVTNDTALYGGKLGANRGIVDNINDVGGYPELFSDWTPKDMDNDGIPDDWEIDNGLDPTNPNDNHTILPNSEYPAIEDYINGIVASNGNFVNPPTALHAELTDVKAITLEWKDNSKNETYFVIQRSDLISFETIDSVPTNRTTYIDTNLLFDKTYTYRVQAITEIDSSVFSNTSSVETLGADGRAKPAHSPYPTNFASKVTVLPQLSWTAGIGSQTHDIYFGTTDPPPFVVNTTEIFFKTKLLEHNSKYYWRIDEVNNNGITEGDTWVFTTKNKIAKELLAHYTFDSPPSINDDSGNGVNGESFNLYSYNFKEGAINKGLFLNGTNQYIYYPHKERINFDINDFSISFWINQDLQTVNKTHSHRYIVKGSNVKNSELERSGKRYEIYYTPDKNIFRFAVDDNITKSEVTADEKLFLKNKWVHVAAIRDTTLKTIKLYADALLVAEVPDNTGDISQNEAMYFSYSVDETAFLEGGFDDVRLFGYALPQNTIDSLFSLGPVGIFNQIVNHQFELYPNPANKKVFLRLTDITEHIITANIYNMLGELIRQYNTEHSVSTNQLVIDVSGLKHQSSNLLLVQIKTNKKTYSTKLIIE